MSYEQYRAHAVGIVVHASQASQEDPENYDKHMGDAISALCLGIAKACAINPDADSRSEILAAIFQEITRLSTHEAKAFSEHMAMMSASIGQAPH